MSQPETKPQARRLDVRELARGKWLRLAEVSYLDAHGVTRTWESAGRCSECGAVVVITRLQPSGRYVLVKQYRPPADAYVLEFPAGLIDDGEDPRLTAVREVKEETGYTGVITWFSGDGLSSPGMSGESVFIAMVDVDETTDENLHPTTDWDESENLEVLVLAPAEIPALLKQCQKDGIILDSKVISHFLGCGLRW